MKKILSRVLFELLLLLLPMAAVWFGIGFGLSRLSGFGPSTFDFSASHLADHALGFFLAYLVSRPIALPLQLEKRAWWSILSYAGLLLVIFILVAFSVASAFAA